jgi:RHH-type rel operon transcriptional repressor/antitoxin RelB
MPVQERRNRVITGGSDRRRRVAMPGRDARMPKFAGSPIAGRSKMWKDIGRGHSMLNVPLDPDIERRLSELAKRTGRTEGDFARELIEGNIEDLEDRYLAEQAIAEGGSRLTSDQVRKALGLDR